ncbi:hypothetical protein PYCCODRAFT_320121 [Trametes coccinea BRFM310]|uniref:Uncharacterized protein n=1 Tax=Trametes coccinea (strain BRFM310) TaxID=1353009 RepID=A0A1Y2IN60_TRAC3|nr:hypothetical protein PYCCODRAFT_320121 [Trametes coccinea BRFM310]
MERLNSTPCPMMPLHPPCSPRPLPRRLRTHLRARTRPYDTVWIGLSRKSHCLASREELVQAVVMLVLGVCVHAVRVGTKAEKKTESVKEEVEVIEYLVAFSRSHRGYYRRRRTGCSAFLYIQTSGVSRGILGFYHAEAGIAFPCPHLPVSRQARRPISRHQPPSRDRFRLPDANA